jgi:iron complex transport system permease protein
MIASRLRHPIYLLWLAFGLLLISLVFGISMGAVRIPFFTTVGWLLGMDNGLSDSQRAILYELRMPRVLTAIIVGSSLAAAGVGFQCLFRNVLAEPYIIGASSGAALGVAIVIVFNFNAMFMGIGAPAIAALLGSVGVVSLVFLVGALGRGSSQLSLLLSGVAISSLANAAVSLLLFLNNQKAMVIVSWLMGSISSSTWSSTAVSGAIGGLGVAILWSRSRALDAYMLGDTASTSLGLDLVRFRLWMIVGGSLATAAAVSSAGIVGFVGLVAPQIARMLVGPKHSYLIPMSVFCGGIVMLLADVLARSLNASLELPVGVLTALLGGPFFFALLMTRSRSRALS